MPVEVRRWKKKPKYMRQMLNLGGKNVSDIEVLEGDKWAQFKEFLDELEPRIEDCVDEVAESPDSSDSPASLDSPDSAETSDEEIEESSADESVVDDEVEDEDADSYNDEGDEESSSDIVWTAEYLHDQYTKRGLIDLAAENGLELSMAASKQSLIEAILDHVAS